MAKCKHTKADGVQCGAWAINGSDFCFSHEPSKAEAKQLAVRAGGMASLAAAGRHLQLKPVTLEAAEDIKKLVATLVNEVRQDAIDPRAASCIGYLAGIFLKAHELAVIEARLNRIENIIEERQAG